MQIVDNSGLEHPDIIDTVDGSIQIGDVEDQGLRLNIQEKPALPPKPEHLSPLPRSISVSSAQEE